MAWLFLDHLRLPCLKNDGGKRCGNCRSCGNPDKEAFGSFYLMISTAAWKSHRKKTLRLSHSYPSADGGFFLYLLKKSVETKHNISSTPQGEASNR
jgi:hypothetical protein